MAISILSRLEAVIDRLSVILDSGNLSEYGDEIPLQEWQTQLDELSSWPRKIETVGFPGFSLEYLLRDSAQLENHLLWLFDGLENLIDALSNLLNKHSILQATESRPIGPSENPGMQKPVHTELESILKGLHQTATSLNQMQSAISHTMPNSRLAGVSQTYIGSFESADRVYVRSSFPNAENGLVNRLGAAISKRRAFFKFWGDNQTNRSKVASSAGCYGASVRIHCNNIPQPPDFREDEVTVECPYCHFLITADHDWIQHLFHDAVPYICVARGCTTPSRLYTDLDQWHLHLTTKHATEFPRNVSFECPLCLEILDYDTSKGHISGHLESLAMHALPGLATNREAESSKRTKSDESLSRIKGRIRKSLQEKDDESDEGSGGEDSTDNKRSGTTSEPDNQERLIQELFHPTKDPLWEAARILTSMRSEISHDSSSEDAEGRASVDDEQHQSPSQVDDMNSIQEQILSDNRQETEETTGLSKLEVHGPVRKTNERETGGHNSTPTLNNKGSLLKCDLCYRIFHGEFAADTHGIEEGHLYFVDVTQSMISQRQKGIQEEESNPRSESPTLSVETKALRKKLWNDYPEKLQDIKNPGEIMKEQRFWDTAETAERSAIKIPESFAPNDNMLLPRLSSLALVLQKQGKFSEATETYQILLARYDATGGGSSLAAFEAMHHFSDLLHEKNDYMGAKRNSRQSLAGIERIKGKSDEMTLLGVQNLAQILESQSKLEEAEALFHRAWKGRKEILGSDNSDTLISLERFAICLQRRGHYCRAEKLLREVLGVYESSFGMNDFKTVQCVFNLSRVLHQQERYQEAKDLYERVKVERAEIFKHDTEAFLVAVHKTGAELRHNGKLKASVYMNCRAAEGLERLKGRSHHTTLACLNGQGVALRLQGRLKEAAKLLLEVAEGNEKSRGRHHPETHKVYLNLANVYLSMGKDQTSESLIRRELEPLRQFQGIDNPITFSALINLTSSISCQGRGREAMDLLVDEVEFFEQLASRSDCGSEKSSKHSLMITMLKAQMDQVTQNTGEERRG